MEKEWDIVEVLRHSRHDWLNKLQLIKGNLDLNRMDRAKEIIDEIVIHAQHEAKLSNLNCPLFASLLLKTNWEGYFFQLEYEVLVGADSIHINDCMLTGWTAAFFDCLNKAVEAFQDNHLSITIDLQHNGVRFFFDFSGIIKNNELIEKFLYEKAAGGMEIDVKEFFENELAFEVFMPC